MKTRTFVIGLVILVIGVALFIGGAFGVLGSITISTTFSQPHSGEYVSPEIVLNVSSDLAVSSPAAVGGVIHAQDLSFVNSTNIDRYTVARNSTGVGTDIYKSLSGDFYYVAFSSTQPDTKIVATPLGSSVIGYGLLVLLGIVCGIAGVVVTIVGAVQKKPQPDQGRA